MTLDKKTAALFKKIADARRKPKVADNGKNSEVGAQEGTARSRRRYGQYPDPIGPRQLLVPKLSNDPRLVGTAFDYLLRFRVEQWNPAAIKTSWIAERTATELSDMVQNGSCWYMETARIHMGDRLETVFARDPNPARTLKGIRDLIEFARSEYSQYIRSGMLTRSLLSACSILAKIDWINRGHEPLVPKGLDEFDDAMLDELEHLIAVVDRDIFAVRSICVLNPHFQRDTNRCDADLLIDDRLIEIKVTTQYRNDPRDWDQLFHYYAWFRLAGIEGARPDVCVRRLGIYSARFARYQELEIEGEYRKMAEEAYRRLTRTLGVIDRHD